MKDLNCCSVIFAFFAIFFTSCIDEDKTVLDISGTDKLISLSINTRSVEGDPLAYSFESQIRSVRLYVFDGYDFDRMYYFPKDSLINDNTTPNFLVKVGTNKRISAIINEPLDSQGKTLPVFDNAYTIADLSKIEFDLTSMGLDGNILGKDFSNVYLPMYGEAHNISLDRNHTIQDIQLSVDRSIARVDVYLRNEEENEVKLTGIGFSNSASDVYLRNVDLTYPESGYSSSDMTASDSIINRKDYKLYYSFYVPERIYKSDETNPLQIDLKMNYIDGTTVTHDKGSIAIGNNTNNSSNAKLIKIERNHVYQLKANYVDRKFTTSLTICPWTLLPVQENEIASRDEVKIINCYMAMPGDIVKIPIRNLFYVYPLYEELGKTKIPEGKLTAELIWQTPPLWYVDINGPLDANSVVAKPEDITLEGGEDDRLNTVIVVKTLNVGSAVIALKVDGVIYWTWHIWCTDYNIKTSGSTYISNGYEYMDRNLGALYKSPGGNIYEYGAASEKGYLYEWGRKDPFPSSYKGRGKDTGMIMVMLYDRSSTVAVRFYNQMVDTIPNPDPTTILYSVRNPVTYLTKSKDLFPDETGWCPQVTRRNTLWLSDKKTIFDPCPVGWRVPPFLNNIIPFSGYSNLEYFDNSSSPTSFFVEDGYSLGNITFPTTNYRDESTGGLKKRTSLTLWSSEADPNGKGAYGLRVDSIPITADTEWGVFGSASARAIRCVKDK